ncbi:MAG: hypothetical protein ABSD85_09825 [Acidimicrobiales bacterium]
MPEFLGEAWFEALAAALGSLTTTAGATRSLAGGLAVGQIVTGVPAETGTGGVDKGEVRYTIVLSGDGSASLVRDSTDDAQVIILEDWPTARAIASGASSVTEMLNAGRIKVRGNARALVAAADFLAGIAPVIAATLAGKPAGP